MIIQYLQDQKWCYVEGFSDNIVFIIFHKWVLHLHCIYIISALQNHQVTAVCDLVFLYSKLRIWRIRLLEISAYRGFFCFSPDPMHSYTITCL